MSVRVKICCIQDSDELALVQALGADAAGLVSQMPSGQGTLPDAQIARLAALATDALDTFLLTAETEADRIRAHHKRTRTSSIQLVDAVRPNAYEKLRASLPGIQLVQVVHVTGPSSIEQAVAWAELADALLLASGDPARRELGGTGRTHDWGLSRKIVDRVTVPVWLAGGLHPGNVAEDIRQVRPYGVDVCSGLRPNGRLRTDLLRQFLAATRT